MYLPNPRPANLSGLTEHTRDVAGIPITYVEAGPPDGFPVVLLHGAVFGGNVFFWEMLADLPPGIRAIAPDFPGWGASGKPRATYTMDYYHQFIEDLLNTFEWTQVAIVGHSMGALLGSSFAMRSPARVASLTLLTAPAAWVKCILPVLFWPFVVPGLGEAVLSALPVLGPHNPLGIRRFYEGLMVAPQDLDPARMAVMLQGCLEATADPAHREAFVKTLRANERMLRTYDRSGYIRRFQASPIPTLIVAGDKDPLFPLSLVSNGAAINPSVRLEVIDQCGHFPMWEQEATTKRLLAEWLTQRQPQVV